VTLKKGLVMWSSYLFSRRDGLNKNNEASAKIKIYDSEKYVELMAWITHLKEKLSLFGV